MKWSEIGAEGWEEKLSNGMSQLMREADEKIAEAVVLAGQKFKERANKNDQTNEAKPVEPQRIKGRWIQDSYYDEKYVCDKCGEPCATYINGKPRDKYCKWCGAEMKGEEE